MDEARYQGVLAVADDDGDLDHGPPGDDLDCLTIGYFYFFLACAAVMIIAPLAEAFDRAVTPEPRLFIRLVAAEGLSVDDDPWEPPVFELAVDVDTIPEPSLFHAPLYVGCGEEDATLRVSYRGVILAWGSVPGFTIDGKRQGRSVAGVVTVHATAEGFVVRDVMRNMIWAEQKSLGRAEFDVEGNIPGLGGRLRCKTYLFEDEATEALPPCSVRFPRELLSLVVA